LAKIFYFLVELVPEHVVGKSVHWVGKPAYFIDVAVDARLEAGTVTIKARITNGAIVGTLLIGVWILDIPVPLFQAQR
jgi:hypothetical protein